MNCLTNLLVDLSWAKHLAHFVHRVVVIYVEQGHRSVARLGRPTEDFYDTALNEADAYEVRKVVPRPDRVAKERSCAEGQS